MGVTAGVLLTQQAAEFEYFRALLPGAKGFGHNVPRPWVVVSNTGRGGGH